MIYLPASCALFHIGHLRAIRQCAKHGHGRVIIGLLSDEVIRSYKGEPIIPFKERKEILMAIPEVYKVVKQNTLKPKLTGLKCHIDYVASGDGFEKEELEQMKKYGAKPLKIKYCKSQSSTKIKEKIWKSMKRKA